MANNLLRNAALAALADPTRRAIVEALAREPSAVGQLAGRLPVSRPAVSQHLKVLGEAGLITVEPRGTSRIYALHGDGFAAIRDYLDTLWDDALTAFANHVRKKETEE
ncbi:MAG: metalloregulator ArsR/SmtB family transcription factor [Paracoccaceae bacterium]